MSDNHLDNVGDGLGDPVYQGQVIDPDTSQDDTDSALGDDNASSTYSVSSSVFAYEYENGRRYHAYRAGEYPIPNDEREQDRLDMQHHIYLLIFGGDLYRAPLPKISRCLEVGSGTGI